MHGARGTLGYHKYDVIISANNDLVLVVAGGVVSQPGSWNLEDSEFSFRIVPLRS
jgi:hypothetical protein